MAEILIVEDDLALGSLIEEVLGKSGHSITRAYSGSEALLLLERDSFDLILLDLMLPGADGETVLKQTGSTPVLVISARSDVPTKVSLLMAGASDFLEKPFDLEELQARVVVQLRKSGCSFNNSASGSCVSSSCASVAGFSAAASSSSTASSDYCSGSAPLSWHDLVLQERQLRYLRDDKAMDSKENEGILLSHTEALILSAFMEAPSQTLTRGRLLEILDENGRGMSYESLKVHLSRLRKKLKELSGAEWIESIWGIGYRLAAPAT